MGIDLTDFPATHPRVVEQAPQDRLGLIGPETTGHRGARALADSGIQGIHIEAHIDPIHRGEVIEAAAGGGIRPVAPHLFGADHRNGMRGQRCILGGLRIANRDVDQVS